MNEENETTNARAEIFIKMMEMVSDGVSLNAICKMEGFPARKTVFEWISNDSDLAAQYQTALGMRAEFYADQIMDVSDNVGNPLLVDGFPLRDKDGHPVMVIDAASVQHAKLKADSRKWIASRLLPKKYGEKLDLSGGLTINNMSDEALEQKLAALLAITKPE